MNSIARKGCRISSRSARLCSKECILYVQACLLGWAVHLVRAIFPVMTTLNQSQRSQRKLLVLHWICLLGVPLLVLSVAKVWKLHIVAGGVPSLAMLYEGLRWELLVWLCVASGLAWFSSLPKVRRTPLGFGLLYLSGGTLLLLTMWEHLCFLRTNSLSDLSLMSWLWRTWIEEGWHSAFPGVSMFWKLLTLLPLVLLALPLILSLLPSVRKWLQTPSEDPSDRRAFALFGFWRWGAMGLLFVVVVPPSVFPEAQTVRLYSSTWLNLSRQLWAQDGEKPSLPVATQPLFDVQHVKLVRTSKRPLLNVVLVVMESTFGKETTVEDNELWTTPFLARLTSKGLWVKEMYPVVPSSLQSYIPILCGTYPQIGVLRLAVPGLCLPALLRTVGYKTAFFQSSSVYEYALESLIYNLGFEQFRGVEDYPLHGDSMNHKSLSDEMVMLQPVLSWVDRIHQKGVPFFLTIKTRTPHPESELPPGFPQQRFPRYKGRATRRYLNALRVQDLFLSRLFREIKRRKLLSSTLWIFVGTAEKLPYLRRKGQQTPSRKGQQKSDFSPKELRVSTVLYHPKRLSTPRIIQGLRQHIDLLPTVFDILQMTPVGAIFSGKTLLRPVAKDRRLMMSCAKEQKCLAMLSKVRESIYFFEQASFIQRPAIKGRDPYHKDKDLRPTALQPILMREMLWWRERVVQVYRTRFQHLQQKARTFSEPFVSHPVDAKLGSLVRVVGCRLKPRKVRPGGMLMITYVFQALRRIPRHWRLFFHLGPVGKKQFVNLDHVPVEGVLPLYLWKPDEFVQDTYRVRIPSRYRSGTVLRLYVGLWAPGKGRLPIHGSPGKIQTDGNKRLIVAEFSLAP